MANTTHAQMGFAEVNEAFEQHDIARAVEISHPFMENPARFNQIVLDFLESLPS